MTFLIRNDLPNKSLKLTDCPSTSLCTLRKKYAVNLHDCITNMDNDKFTKKLTTVIVAYQTIVKILKQFCHYLQIRHTIFSVYTDYSIEQ